MSFKYTLLLLLIFILLAGVVLYVQLPLQEELGENPNIWLLEEKSIEFIQIELPKKEQKKIAFLKEKDHWYIDDQNKTPVDFERWGGIVSLVSGPRSGRVIAENTTNFEVYGFTTPSMLVTLNIQDQKLPVRVIVGDHTPDQQSIYVRLEDSNTIYLLDQSWIQILERLVLEPPRKESRTYRGDRN